MKNWKDYVGYQPSALVLFYLTTKHTQIDAKELGYADSGNEVPHISFTIERIKLKEENFTIPESEVGGVVEQLLYQFPHKEASTEKFELQRHIVNVARETRRGMANKNWKNVWYYAGSSAFDHPILVTEYNGKYAVVKHPAFEKYGFVMKKPSLWKSFLNLIKKLSGN